MSLVFNIIKKDKSIFFIWITLCCALNSFTGFSQDRSRQEIEKDIKIIKQTRNYEKDTIYINLLNELGKEYSNYNLDSLLIISNKTIELSKALNYNKGEIEAYIIKGGYYSDIGEQEKAITYLKDASIRAEQIHDNNLIIRSKSDLATEYMYKEEYAKSLKTFLSTIELAQAINKEEALPALYINISVLYSLQKDYDQRIFFLKKAMEVNEKQDNARLTAITLSNLAYTYIEINDLKSAYDPVTKAIEIFENLNQDSWLTYAYEIKGKIYLKRKKYNNAIFWLKKSEKLNENIDQTRYKIPLYLLFSETYFGLNNNELAESYALKALEISKDLNSLENRDEILQVLYEIKKADNDLEQALTYLEDLKTVSDTINKNNNIRELRILKSNLEFEQEKEKYILESEQKQVLQNSYIYFSIIIILAFAIIIFILKRNNKTQNSLNLKLLENTKALEKNEKHLKETNNTKSKLFSIIAHDLKGPINSFKSLFDLFNQSELSQSEFMQFMPQIGGNIDSIAFTLNNLLSWGQSQMNGLTTKPNHTKIKRLVGNNFKLLSKQAESKSITTINNVDEKIVAWCDQDQIDIVIRNLISNAMKFTREHGIISVSATEKLNNFEILVKDNGVGMSKDTVENIFIAKDTSTSYGTRNEKGTGLGLRVCKEMVENNGGQIWVESELDKGSIFYFTIPKTT